MVFLNPAFLWAAFAALIPIIIHLFNFRKPKRMNFSSVAFVREVNRSVVRRMRLQHWLLLAARVLGILALVLLFSGPVWVNKPGQAGSTGARSVLILIDDSPSMQVGDNEGVFLNQAVKMAKTLLERGNAQDEYLVLPFSELRQGQPFQKGREAGARLDQITFGHNPIPMSRVVQLLPGLLEKALLPDKTVYLLSDFQQTAHTLPADFSPSALSLENTRIVAVPVGRSRPANVFVRDLTLLDPVLEKGQANGLSGILVNQSGEPAQDVEIALQLNGKATGSARVSAAPGDTASFVLNFTPDKSGWNSGRIQTGDGITGFDDIRYLSFNLPDTQKILVATGDGLEDKYLRTVLDKVLRQFSFTWVNARQLGNEDPSRYSAVLLAGVDQLPAGVARRLSAWVTEGGSILVMPHPAQELSGMNVLLQALGVGQFTARKEIKDGLDIKAPDAAHPLFEGVFRNGKNAKAQSPVVFAWYPFQKTANGVQEIMKFPDGSPFLWEGRPGKGQIMGMGVYPDSRMSDLPMKSIFLPIVYRSLLLLTHSSRAGLSYESGMTDPVVLKSSGNQEVIRLKSSDGVEFVPEQFNRPGQVVLNFQRQYPRPGIYQESASGELMAFNYPAAESDLMTLRGNDLQQSLAAMMPAGAQLSVLESSQDNFAKDLEVQEAGFPLWKWFLFLVLFALLAEMAISWWGMRRQSDEWVTENTSQWKTNA